MVAVLLDFSVDHSICEHGPPLALALAYFKVRVVPPVERSHLRGLHGLCSIGETASAVRTAIRLANAKV